MCFYACVFSVLCVFSKVVMDRSWVNDTRLSEEYKKGVEVFIQFSFEKLPNNNGRFCCPCAKCLNIGI
jgi:hypothetical protein